MSGKDNPQNVIKKFEKRQKSMPYLLGGLAGVLVIVGIVIIIVVMSGDKKPLAGLFASKTPTVTITLTPTATQPSATPTLTATITETPTLEATETPSQPFQYTVKEGEDCWTIAYNNNADLNYLMMINPAIVSGDACIINPGDIIYVPAPGQKMPTPTRVPLDVARATRYEYTIQAGDTLATIADYFYSTVDDILAQNPDIEDQNAINVGDVITVRANMVTPTSTVRATSTLSTPQTPTPSPTATTKP